MARITIEDCIEKVPNRFHLVQMTAIRAKQLKKGARPLVSNDENKEVVVALREIAEGFVTVGLPEDAAVEEQGESGSAEAVPGATLEASAGSPPATESAASEQDPPASD